MLAANACYWLAPTASDARILAGACLLAGLAVARLPGVDRTRIAPTGLLGMMLLGLLWGLAGFEYRLHDRLSAHHYQHTPHDPATGLLNRPDDFAGNPADYLGHIRIELVGEVVGLPEAFQDRLRFRFRADGGQRMGDHNVPGLWLLTIYRHQLPVEPGERWSLHVNAKPPWGRVNFSGFDRERWLFAAGIGAQGTVLGGTRLQSHQGRQRLARWRQRLVQDIDLLTSSERGRALVRALAVADRSALPSQDREILSATGTAHLLAISGLHIGLAAAFGYALARLLCLLPMLAGIRFNSRAFSVLAGLGLAVAYAALAGWGTSSQRALVMLGVGSLAMLGQWRIPAHRGLVLALSAVLLLEPLAPMTPGFWLSFGAVAALLAWFAPRRGRRFNNRHDAHGNSYARPTASAPQGSAPGPQTGMPRAVGGWLISRLCSILQAQWAVSLLTVPLVLAWLDIRSAVSLPANLLAIPWVSIVTVPLVLTGVFFSPVNEHFSAAALQAASLSADLLLKILQPLAAAGTDWSSGTRPANVSLALALLGGALLLLPRHRLQFLALPMLVPLLLIPQAWRGEGWRLEVLDVGQGSAALLERNGRLLLYDTGPGDGVEASLVSSVIDPAIRQRGYAFPHTVVASHGDLDHAGGMGSIRARYEGAAIIGFKADPTGREALCRSIDPPDLPDSRWSVLHPSGYLPYQGNDSSCVLSMRDAHGSVLFPGDISERVERRLLALGLQPHDLVLVPHHGSRSSSSREFLAGLQPQIAIATAALGNRFGFPHHDIALRYRQMGVRFWSTDACGAIRLQARQGRFVAESARLTRAAVWRWPAGAHCP